MIDAAAQILLKGNLYLDEWKKLSKRVNKEVIKRNNLAHFGLVLHTDSKGKTKALLKPSIFNVKARHDDEYDIEQIDKWRESFIALRADLSKFLNNLPAKIQKNKRTDGDILPNSERGEGQYILDKDYQKLKERKMKKVIVLFLALSLLALSVDGIALECTKYEYAELKDMDKDYLNRIYCELKITKEGNMKLIDHGLARKKDYNDRQECADQMMKAYRAFKSKFNEEPTICDELIKPSVAPAQKDAIAQDPVRIHLQQ